MARLALTEIELLSLNVQRYREDIVRVISMEVVDSEDLSFPSKSYKRVDERDDEFLGQLIDLAMCSNMHDIIKLMHMLNGLF